MAFTATANFEVNSAATKNIKENHTNFAPYAFNATNKLNSVEKLCKIQWENVYKKKTEKKHFCAFFHCFVY